VVSNKFSDIILARVNGSQIELVEVIGTDRTSNDFSDHI